MDGSTQLRLEDGDLRALKAHDLAILTRTNRQAFELQRALRQQGIAAVVLGDQSVFSDEQGDAYELQLLLTAIAEPGRSGAVKAALDRVVDRREGDRSGQR